DSSRRTVGEVEEHFHRYWNDRTRDGKYWAELKEFVEKSLKRVDLFGGGYMTPLGGRFYMDHGYFEGCTPESADPFELLACELAQDELIAEEFGQLFGDDPRRPRLYKNISDGQGHSQAAHRNFCISQDLWFRLMSWESGIVDFNNIRSQTRINRETMLLATWHVVEQILGGAGKYGWESPRESNLLESCAIDRSTFQLSGRADFITCLISSNTVMSRPLINCRLEPLAQDSLGRYHCINGDATRAHWSYLFKIGLTAIFLGMIEDDFYDLDYYVCHPVQAVRNLSRNPELNEGIEVFFPRSHQIAEMKPINILKDILSEMGRYLSSREVPSWCGKIYEKAVWAVHALEHHRGLLDNVLDWRIKQYLGDRASSPFAIHSNYHALYGPTLLYKKLVERGLVETVIGAEEIKKYRTSPAETSRAYFRGQFLRHFYGQVSFERTSWDRICLFEPKRYISLSYPLGLTRADCGAIFEKEDLMVADLEHFFSDPGRR
ncbi:MAG: proteasome accessory factor PafA2 family protein, partial [bacterium]|nr:proteasome accessory factor PafA2 family protein [bacterium]